MLPRFPIRVVPEWLLDRWILVAYLIINWQIKELAEGVQIRPDKQFYGIVTEHVGAYIEEGIMPPAEIAPAILNLADDLMAGKPMNIRAGDYIAIQNFMKQGKQGKRQAK